MPQNCSRRTTARQGQTIKPKVSCLRALLLSVPAASLSRPLFFSYRYCVHTFKGIEWRIFVFATKYVPNQYCTSLFSYVPDCICPSLSCPMIGVHTAVETFRRGVDTRKQRHKVALCVCVCVICLLLLLAPHFDGSQQTACMQKDDRDWISWLMCVHFSTIRLNVNACMQIHWSRVHMRICMYIHIYRIYIHLYM